MAEKTLPDGRFEFTETPEVGDKAKVSPVEAMEFGHNMQKLAAALNEYIKNNGAAALNVKDLAGVISKSLGIDDMDFCERLASHVMTEAAKGNPVTVNMLKAFAAEEKNIQPAAEAQPGLSAQERNTLQGKVAKSVMPMVPTDQKEAVRAYVDRLLGSADKPGSAQNLDEAKTVLSSLWEAVKHGNDAGDYSQLRELTGVNSKADQQHKEVKQPVSAAELKSFAKTGTELNQLKKAENQLAKAKDQLEAAQAELKEVGGFWNSLAHPGSYVTVENLKNQIRGLTSDIAKLETKVVELKAQYPEAAKTAGRLASKCERMLLSGNTHECYVAAKALQDVAEYFSEGSIDRNFYISLGKEYLYATKLSHLEDSDREAVNSEISPGNMKMVYSNDNFRKAMEGKSASEQWSVATIIVKDRLERQGLFVTDQAITEQLPLALAVREGAKDVSVVAPGDKVLVGIAPDADYNDAFRGRNPVTFLKGTVGIKDITQASSKEDILSGVKNGAQVLWVDLHGSPGGIYTGKDTYISPEELAQAVVKGGNVKTIMLEACSSSAYAINVYNALGDAYQRGELAAMPVIIAEAGRGQYGFNDNGTLLFSKNTTDRFNVTLGQGIKIGDIYNTENEDSLNDWGIWVPDSKLNITPAQREQLKDLRKESGTQEPKGIVPQAPVDEVGINEPKTSPQEQLAMAEKTLPDGRFQFTEAPEVGDKAKVSPVEAMEFGHNMQKLATALNEYIKNNGAAALNVKDLAGVIGKSLGIDDMDFCERLASHVMTEAAKGNPVTVNMLKAFAAGEKNVQPAAEAQQRAETFANSQPFRSLMLAAVRTVNGNFDIARFKTLGDQVRALAGDTNPKIKEAVTNFVDAISDFAETGGNLESLAAIFGKLNKDAFMPNGIFVKLSPAEIITPAGYKSFNLEFGVFSIAGVDKSSGSRILLLKNREGGVGATNGWHDPVNNVTCVDIGSVRGNVIKGLFEAVTHTRDEAVAGSVNIKIDTALIKSIEKTLKTPEQKAAFAKLLNEFKNCGSLENAADLVDGNNQYKGLVGFMVQAAVCGVTAHEDRHNKSYMAGLATLPVTETVKDLYSGAAQEQIMNEVTAYLMGGTKGGMLEVANILDGAAAVIKDKSLFRVTDLGAKYIAATALVKAAGVDSIEALADKLSGMNHAEVTALCRKAYDSLFEGVKVADVNAGGRQQEKTLSITPQSIALFEAYVKAFGEGRAIFNHRLSGEQASQQVAGGDKGFAVLYDKLVEKVKERLAQNGQFGANELPAVAREVIKNSQAGGFQAFNIPPERPGKDGKFPPIADAPKAAAAARLDKQGLAKAVNEQVAAQLPWMKDCKIEVDAAGQSFKLFDADGRVAYQGKISMASGVAAMTELRAFAYAGDGSIAVSQNLMKVSADGEFRFNNDANMLFAGLVRMALAQFGTFESVGAVRLFAQSLAVGESVELISRDNNTTLSVSRGIVTLSGTFTPAQANEIITSCARELGMAVQLAVNAGGKTVILQSATNMKGRLVDIFISGVVRNGRVVSFAPTAVGGRRGINLRRLENFAEGVKVRRSADGSLSAKTPKTGRSILAVAAEKVAWAKLNGATGIKTHFEKDTLGRRTCRFEANFNDANKLNISLASGQYAFTGKLAMVIDQNGGAMLARNRNMKVIGAGNNDEFTILAKDSQIDLAANGSFNIVQAKALFQGNDQAHVMDIATPQGQGGPGGKASQPGTLSIVVGRDARGTLIRNGTIMIQNNAFTATEAQIFRFGDDFRAAGKDAAITIAGNKVTGTDNRANLSVNGISKRVDAMKYTQGQLAIGLRMNADDVKKADIIVPKEFGGEITHYKWTIGKNIEIEGYATTFDAKKGSYTFFYKADGTAQVSGRTSEGQMLLGS
ncbi:MAG: hypothetical protein WC522_09500, partial [Candidatus Omnitrophota bacterium]